MHTQLIRAGYNQVGPAYNHDRHRLRTTHYVTQLLQRLPRAASILDIGCGCGDPVAAQLIQKGHLVTGLDISETQIELARKNFPRGEFFVRDLQTLQPNEFSVDAIVCFYTLFHVPREQHAELLQTFASYLRPGGMMLISMGEKDFEGEHPFYGTTMWSSQYGPETNRAMITQAGFEIELDTIDRSGEEAHQILLVTRTD